MKAREREGGQRVGWWWRGGCRWGGEGGESEGRERTAGWGGRGGRERERRTKEGRENLRRVKRAAVPLTPPSCPPLMKCPLLTPTAPPLASEAERPPPSRGRGAGGGGVWKRPARVGAAPGGRVPGQIRVIIRVQRPGPGPLGSRQCCD